MRLDKGTFFSHPSQHCLSMVAFICLGHGSHVSMVTDKRRPTVPYLFLLVAETLQQSIKSNHASIRHPIENSLPCPVLRYVDDTLIVVRGEAPDVANIKHLLDMFFFVGQRGEIPIN